MPRLSSYCGQFLRHGGWWPDRVLRLFRRESGRFSDRVVHESVQVGGSVERLRGHLVHYPFPTVESVINKFNSYSTAGAQAMREQDRGAGVLQAVLHGTCAFWRGYVFRAGFLDGRRGLMAAVSSAEHTYYRYIKRWLMEQARLGESGDSRSAGTPAPAKLAKPASGDVGQNTSSAA
jgi:hypothetical protein